MTKKAIPAIIDFTNKHPALVKWLAIGSVALLAFGVALKVVSIAMGVFDAVMALNPFVWIVIGIVAAVAAIAILVYKWDSFVKWLQTTNPILKFAITTLFAPIIFLADLVHTVIANWSQITGFFVTLWKNVIDTFNRSISFITNLPAKFLNVGRNIILNIWKGITAEADKLVNKVEDVAKRIRNFFPFSPAKAGPLRDLHKMKLMETIAATISPSPLMKAMQNSLATFGNYHSSEKPQYGRNAGMTLSYSPTIHIGAGTNKEDFARVLKSHSNDIIRILRDHQSNERRKSL